LKSGILSPPNLFFFFWIILAILHPLDFPMSFRIDLSISIKKAPGILEGLH
jgi:hypothetical protein